MPWYRLTTYPIAGRITTRRFQAANIHEARGRYLAERDRPHVRTARLENAAGHRLLGCEDHGVAVQQGRLPLGAGR
jgi:hypothetical protein